MTLNAKAILSAAGIAAALASPVMAKTYHVPAAPADAYGYAGQRGGHNGQAQTVYAPDVPVPPHNGGVNPDFQLGSEKN